MPYSRVYHETKPSWIRVKHKCFEIKVYLWSPNDWSEKLNLYTTEYLNIYDFYDYQSIFYSWTENTITDRKSCVPNPHSKLANWDTKWKRDRTPWNGRCPYRWELSIGEEPKSLYISRPVRYTSLKYGFCKKWLLTKSIL